MAGFVLSSECLGCHLYQSAGFYSALEAIETRGTLSGGWRARWTQCTACVKLYRSHRCVWIDRLVMSVVINDVCVQSLLAVPFRLVQMLIYCLFFKHTNCWNVKLNAVLNLSPDIPKCLILTVTFPNALLGMLLLLLLQLQLQLLWTFRTVPETKCLSRITVVRCALCVVR
jgi:hypothetical protein